jgi:hypothetical protein
MITFKEYLVEKPLTPSQRMARSRMMKRLAPRIKAKRKIAMKKKASPEKIKSRAEKKAREIVRQKFLAKGQNYATLSFAQKIQLDKKVEKKKALIKKIAKKLIPKIKKQEAERIQSLNKNPEATAS